MFTPSQDSTEKPDPKINGGWSEWSEGECSATCGSGKLTKTRTCSNPEPANGGYDCVGDEMETVDCQHLKACDIGEYATWNETYFDSV